ncbi:SDR family oxidoreductase [Pseudonocardia acaciae]|uniref:SDR family oxidoreductase n=1 Tax=Pseudonocardia acaciae TaxID=551276 RepID=UPI00048D07C8|nr:SDR family oxidoreductase [Pseudonocardia acaciae]
MRPDTLVIGGGGLIGRWLLPELTRRGRTVAALVRDASTRGGELRSWVAAHGGDPAHLVVTEGDLTAPGLGLANAAGLDGVRDVYNLGARFAFGLTAAQARRTNVDGALEAVRWAARLPAPRRFVHISGYRVGSNHTEAPDYRRGAYEASKVEAHRAVLALTAELGLPVAVVNPSTVIGDSVTGETTQYIGLASLVRDLSRGKLPAVPGGRDTWVPVVTADHLARFLAAVPHHAPDRAELWVLDEDTPKLPELIGHLARRLGVPAPRLRVPAAVLRLLPRALTGADPETLTFLSADGYPTASARALARAAGLQPPPLPAALDAWTDHLVATNFGEPVRS